MFFNNCAEKKSTLSCGMGSTKTDKRSNNNFYEISAKDSNYCCYFH